MFRRADNPPSRRPTPLRHPFFHQDFPSWIADSFRGIRLALTRGFRWEDTNYLLTKDGFLVNIHWARPLMHGWHDPLRKIRRRTPVSEMTLVEVQRLVSRTGGYRIHTAEQMVVRSGDLGEHMELELKRCQPSYERMCSVADVAKAHNTTVVVKSLTNPGTVAEAVERLGTSHRAGFPTCILPRGLRRVPRAAWPVLDHVRGPVIWTGPLAKEAQ